MSITKNGGCKTVSTWIIKYLSSVSYASISARFKLRNSTKSQRIINDSTNMSGMSRKGKGRSSHCSALSTSSKSSGGPLGCKPRALGVDSDSRSSTPVSVASGGTSSRISARLAASGKNRLTPGAARKKSRKFIDDVIEYEDEDLAMDVDFHDPEDSQSNSDAEEEANDDLDGSFDETGSVWSEASDETSASNVSKLMLLPRRPKSPEFIDDEDIPVLELPESSDDLFIEGQNLMQALGVYDVMRHFSANLRMSPFRFEDFCAALCTDEQSSLLVEMHIMLLRALLREDDGNNTLFGPQDVKDSINILLFMIDSMTWFEIIRAYLESDNSPEFSQALPALEKPSYSSLTISERLQILQTLTNLFLSTNPVREEITNEGNINYDDHCRSCHRLGDLLCCDTCPAVYHLACLDLPEVPEDDWICSVCKLHQVKGVTDCMSEAEKSGLLCRQEPIGYDRHCRKYWFLCRRIIVESEDEVKYYGTQLHLDDLIDSLDAERYEKDLVNALIEMKDEIVRQMAITEELTKENQGNRKSALEVSSANLAKLRSERAVRLEEEKVKKQEAEENDVKMSADCQGSMKTGEKEEGIDGDIHMEVDEIKDEFCQSSKAGSINEVISSKPSKSESTLVKKEPKTDIVNVKENKEMMCNVTGTVTATTSDSHDLVLHDSENLKGSNSHSEMEAVKVETEEVETKADEAVTKVTSEGRRIVTRSKTGSLTPKQFTDSVTISTTTKGTNKTATTLDENTMSRDGDGVRLTRSKTAMSASAFLLSQSLYFKLGAEGNFKLYQNQYSANPLALNKNQHNEEREKKRHLSHKFSLTPVSEFTWNGSMFGSTSLLIGTLRQSILQLESNLPVPFLHPKWPQHHARWTKLVNAAMRPEDFANVLAMLESSMKPVLFNQVWHEALGHTKLRRTPVLDREEVKKREREQRRRKDEDDEPGKNTWVKYSLGLRHQVWKQKGEEYRVMGQGGWMWISATRMSRFVPATSVGLRLLAAKLQARKKKALEKSKLVDEGGSGLAEKKETGKTEGILNEKSGLIMMEEDSQEEAKDLDEDVDVEDIAGMKVEETDNFDISKALVNRTHYSRITKPYSRLEHLLDRRLKLAELEQKQQTVFEQLIRHYHCQETAKKQRTADSQAALGDAASAVVSSKAVKPPGQGTAIVPAISAVGMYQCYSATCRSKSSGEGHCCYSVTCHDLESQLTSNPNLIDELPNLDLANGDMGDLESEDEGCNNEVSLDHDDKDDASSQLNNDGDNSSVYEDLMKMRSQFSENLYMEKLSKIASGRNLSKKEDVNAASLPLLKNACGKGTVISTGHKVGVSDSGATLTSLTSFFQDGKLQMTPELILMLEARLAQMGKTELPVLLTKRGPGRPSKSAPSVRTSGLLKKGAIPGVHRFLTPSKKSSLFVLRRHFLRSLARLEGKRETPGFNYACKMNNVNWLYPCPRPYFKTAWEYRTMTMRNLPAVAAQLRVFWACIRWDDLAVKLPASGTNTITTETDITTTKLLKRRDVGPYGLRSEFLVRKIVIPISVPSQPREKYTPQRSGLRERRRPESPKHKEPSVTESWVPEEQLELWEIKLFGDRIEKQNLLALEKKAQQQKQAAAAEVQKTVWMDKTQLDEQIKNSRLSVGLKRTADGQLKTPDVSQKASGSTGIKSVPLASSSLVSSTNSGIRMIQIQQPAQRSLLTNSSNPLVSSSSTPTAATAASSHTVQNLRIIHGPNGQLQVQGLLPGQQIIRLPNGQLHLVTTAARQTQQSLQSKPAPSLLLPSQAAQAGSEATVIGATATDVSLASPTVSNAQSSATDSEVSSTSAIVGARPFSGQVAVVGGQRIVLAGSSLLSQTSTGSGVSSAAKPGQSLSKFVVTAGGSLALPGQRQQLLVTGGSSPKLVKLPLQLQQPQQQQQQTKVMLPSGQVISGQPTVVRTSTGQHFIIQPSIAPLPQQKAPAPSISSDSTVAAPAVTDSPNSLMSTISLTTSPSATSPVKYTVTPQVLQQVVNQALMQTQDPEITAKLLVMQKVMQQQQQQQPSVVSNDVNSSQQLNLKPQQPVKTSFATHVIPVKHQKGLTQEQKEEQARLSACNQVIKGILDSVEKHEKHELKRQRKQETSDEKVRRLSLQKLEGQLSKKKEMLKKEILRKRNILEKTITTKIQAEVTQLLEAHQHRKIIHTKRNRPESNLKMEMLSPSVTASDSVVMTPPVACELEVKEPKSKRRKHKVVTIGITTKQGETKASNSDEKLYCLCKTPYDESKFYIGCDRCEDWFHGSCVGVTKSEADRMDTYVCPSCRMTSGDNLMNQTRLMEQHQLELRKLLNMVKSHRMSWPFREPVCPKEVPDYYTIIKEPMDLSTVENKLLSHRYSTLGEFVKDVTKIFDNCRYYNPSSSQFYRCAEALEVYFVEKLKLLKEKLKL